MDQNATLNDLLGILSEKPINLDRLREFGRVYGFVNPYGRNLAITCLAESMGNGKKTGSKFEQLKKKTTEIVSASKFQHQIHIDVERAMNSIDFFIDLQEEQLKYHRGNLEQLLQLFIANNSEYSYYQGFHDITTVLLYTFGLNDAFNILYKLSENYFMDALKYPFEKSVNIQLQLVLKILENFDPEYAEAISIAYGGVPVFAVSWILTWFSHSFKKVDVIQRIFDFLISSPPSSILYMCASIILISKEKLLATATDDLDIAVIHSFFQKLDIDDPDFLISTTIEMEKQLKFQKVLENSGLTLPEESIFRLEKRNHSKNRYYQHQLQRESQALLLSVSGKQNKVLQEKIMKNIGTVGFVVFLSLVSYKVFSRKKI